MPVAATLSANRTHGITLGMKPRTQRCNVLLRRYLSVLVCLFSCKALALEVDTDDLQVITAENIRESMIAFVNVTTGPGLGGATLRVDQRNRESDLLRGGLEVAGDYTLRDTVADFYWGGALAYGALDDELEALGVGGRRLRLNVERSIISLRGSAGFNLPVSQHLTVRPYLSVAGSRLETNTRIQGPDEINLPEIYRDSSVDALTTTASLVAEYDRWQGTRRVEIKGHYNLAYTDTFNASDAGLETWGWNNTLLLRFRYSDALPQSTRGKPWRWNAYAIHTEFFDLDERALGFNAYHELGVGIDYEINIRPLNWFGMRFVGFKVGYLFGDGVDGFSVGITF